MHSAGYELPPTPTARQVTDNQRQAFLDTAPERRWINQAGYDPYVDNVAIARAEARGELVALDPVGVGFRQIGRLVRWQDAFDDPGSELPFPYPPAYLRPEAVAVARYVAEAWQDGVQDGALSLSFTSLVRHVAFQQRIIDQGKVAIDPSEGVSSHLVGLAFDIDGCGMYFSDGDQVIGVNPNPNQDETRLSMYRDLRPRLDDGFAVLRSVLGEMSAEGTVNVVEELSGINKHCFHICANPTV